MKCDKNCLECKLIRCLHDIEDREIYIQDFEKKKERIRHAEYYKEHKAEIDSKQKEYDRKHRTKQYIHDYYMKHKSEINQRNKERYKKDRAKQIERAKAYYYAHREEIRQKSKQRYQEKKAKDLSNEQ